MSEINEHKSAKKDHTKIWAVIVLIISAIVFIPVGGVAVFESLFSDRDVPVFGTFRGNKIEYKQGSRFNTQLTNLRDTYESRGYQINSQSQFSIFQQTFQQCVQQIFYEDAVKKSGWTVPKDAINRMIYPYFTDANGKYSVRLYNQTPESTKNEMRTSATKALIYQRYTNDILGEDIGLQDSRLYGAKVSSKEAEFVLGMGKEKHSFALVSWDASNIPQEEVLKYAKDNTQKFVKYNYSALTMDTEEEANTLLNQLQNNEITFEDAVTERSGQQYIQEDGKLASPYYYQLEKTIPNEEDLKTVLDITTGTLSKVVKTQSGYSIFRKDGEAEQPSLDDEATINVISSYIKSNERGFIENYWISIAEGFVSEATVHSFDEAIAKSTDEEGNETLEKIETSAFPLNYNNSPFFDTIPTDIPAIASLNTSEKALKTMFSLKNGQVSSPFVLGTNVIVAQCTGIETDNDLDTSSYISQVSYYDSRSSANTLLTSDELDDQFYTTYFTYFISN